MSKFFSACLDFFKNLFPKKDCSSPQDDPVPDLHHILRYIKPTGFQNGKVNGSEFLKKPDHKGTSVNWIEYFAGNLENQIEEIRTRRRIEYRKNGGLVRLNVGTVKKFVGEETKKVLPNEVLLSIVQDPLKATKDYPEDLSHALITNVPTFKDSQGEFIGDLIRQCVIDVHPAVSNK